MIFGSGSPILPAGALRRRLPKERQSWLLASVIALFLALGIVYNVTVPIFEAPDEIQHFYYIKHLADGKGLPVQGSAESRQAWAQEGGQPPLYYLLGALVIRGMDTSDAGEVIWYNPQANIGTPRYPGNKNRIIHTEWEQFPYEGTVQAVHALRLYSLLWGCGTVLLIYFLAREVFRRQDLALLTAACAAFTPQFIFIHSAVSNDSLITLLGTLGVWLMVRMLGSERPARYALPLGATLGLAVLAKLSGLALWGLAGLLLAYLVWRRRLSIRQALTAGILMAVPALLIAGPWFARNLRLYGDLVGLGPMLEIVGRRTDRPTLADIWGEFRGLRISFWGLFGWFNILLPEAIYKTLDAITLLAGLGLMIGAMRRRLSQLARRSAAALMGAWLTLMFISLVRWTAITMGTQGRLLFPAIASFMILLVIGLAQWWPEKWRFRILLPLPAALLLLSILSPFLVIQPAYARPPILTTAGEVPAAARIDPLTFGEDIRLVGMEIPQTEAQPGDTLDITLYWECLASMQEDYNITVKLWGRGMQIVGAVDTYPGWGTYPTSLWVPGQVIQDHYEIAIDPQAPAPSILRVDVGVYPLETLERLPAYDAHGKALSLPTTIAVLRLAPNGPAAYTIPYPTRFRWENGMLLEGYALDKEAGAGILPLQLFWRAEHPLDEDYTIFVHLVDRDGQTWSQHDKPPLDGEYPTSFWRPGETVMDTYALSLAGVPAGTYWLEVGLYPSAGGPQPLGLVDDQGNSLGNQLLLTFVRVQP